MDLNTVKENKRSKLKKSSLDEPLNKVRYQGLKNSSSAD